ncbi:MAG: Na+/H+ antiporter subunit E [Chromatiales bacterium]|jgi:multicomponent K+:H+ antiporter subunit E
MTRLLPQPVLSAILVVLWLLLVNTVTLGHVVLAVMFAVLVPQVTHRFWPNRPHTTRPLLALRLTGIVLWDIAVANLAVARLVLGPLRRLSPAFVFVPLDIDDELAITILASIISLTPGTVSVDVTDDRRRLLVHCLDAPDQSELIGQIKQRYERPLKEIFQC